jgi:hypothetical protein
MPLGELVLLARDLLLTLPRELGHVFLLDHVDSLLDVFRLKVLLTPHKLVSDF